MQINLITSNLGKLKEFRLALEPEVKINHIKRVYREVRSDDPEEIAKEAAERLAKELKKPVVVEDSGLFIKALKGFPGTCSSYIHKRIGLKGILKLMENIDERTCSYKSAVAYCKPDSTPISFLGKERGTLSKEIKGNRGFGHDPVFIPENSGKTYGEMENYERYKKFRKNAIQKLKKYLVEEQQ